MRPPRGALHDTRVRILLAVVAMRQRGDAPNYTALMSECGISRTSLHGHLVALRDAGLVEWQPWRQHTLMPTVYPVNIAQTWGEAT